WQYSAFTDRRSDPWSQSAVGGSCCPSSCVRPGPRVRSLESVGWTAAGTRHHLGRWAWFEPRSNWVGGIPTGPTRVSNEWFHGAALSPLRRPGTADVQIGPSGRPAYRNERTAVCTSVVGRRRRYSRMVGTGRAV